MAPTIGISVDHRRRNRSLESLQANVNRLKAYKANLVVFPRKSSAPKKGDSPADDLTAVEQLSGVVMPIQKTISTMEFAPVTEDMKVLPALFFHCNFFVFSTSLFSGGADMCYIPSHFSSLDVLCSALCRNLLD